MAIRSKPFYWIMCDAEGCTETWPDNDGVAYARKDYLDNASDSEWIVVNWQHYCPNHANWHCRMCGIALTENESDAGEYECFKCSPALVEGER